MSLDAGRVGVRADQVDIHGRVTSPSFLNELLEDLPEWTDMPVWVNGTEEVLPSNTSVPVTSPILTDIAYPDIRRDNQYFTYRESPTPVDGLAKIKSIKGNTLTWNQLMQNGNFANIGSWQTPADYGSITVENNTLKYTALQIYKGAWYNRVYCPLTKETVSGHKLLIKMDIDAPKNCNLTVVINNATGQSFNEATAITPSQKHYFLTGNVSAPGGSVFASIFNLSANYSAGDNVNISNVQIFDMTLMGLASLTSQEFESLFLLPYYEYNTGSLLSFNGNGLKTVGFNQWDEEWENGFIDASTGLPVSNPTRFRSKNFALLFPQKQYYIYCGQNEETYVFWYDSSQNYISRQLLRNTLFTTPEGARYFKIGVVGYSAYENDICINFSDPSRNGTYEPYTESIATLPIQQYFPTGMKSAGSVYDELTPTRAITRIGAVDLGSLTWNYNSSASLFIATISDLKPATNFEERKSGLKCAKYPTSSVYVINENMDDKSMLRNSNNPEIIIRDTSYTSASAFKTDMSGVYLYYELATPVELPTLSLGE